MWKTIFLCASLFGGVALGLAAAAEWVRPGALPAVAAISLCLVGVTLILSAHVPEAPPDEGVSTRAITTAARPQAIELPAPAAQVTQAAQPVEKVL